MAFNRSEREDLVRDECIKVPGGAHYSQDIGVEFAGKPESQER